MEDNHGGERLLLLSSQLKELNKLEQERLQKALETFKRNLALFVVLLMAWIMRTLSTEESSLVRAVAASVAVVSVLLVLHKSELQAIHNARDCTDNFNQAVQKLSEEVTQLMETRKELVDELDRARKTEVFTFNSSDISESSKPRHTMSERKPKNRQSLIGRVFSRRRKEGSMLEEVADTASETPKRTSSSRSVSFRLRRMSLKRKSQSSGAFSATASVGSEKTIMSFSEDEDVDDTQVQERKQNLNESSNESSVFQSEVVEGQDEIMFHTMALPRTEDICQPPALAGIAELKALVADVANPHMVHKLGGEVRCYERYLRARGGKLPAAEKMFRETCKFRTERQLDDLECERTKTRLETFDRFRYLWAGRFMDFTTNDGSPIQFFRFKDVKPKQLMQDITEEQFADFYVTWMEQTLDLQNKANSKQYQSVLNRDSGSNNPRESKPYEWKNFIEIHDLGGIGRTQLYMPGVMMLTRVLKVGQGNYPENLRGCFICNAPWFFSATWSLISRVLDPATREKIIVSNKIPRERMQDLLTDEQIDLVFALTESNTDQK